MPPASSNHARTLVFDFDGTIADSFSTTLAIANRLARIYGYRPLSDEDANYLRGRSYREAAEHMGLSWHKLPLIAHHVRRDMRASAGQLQMFEGMLPVLDELRRSYTLGILSSNSRENIESFTAAHGLKHFKFIHSASNIWGKARGIRALIRRHRLRQEEVVYVGDEVRDVEACQDVPVKVIAVGWGYTHPQRLSLSQPDRLIHHPDELPNAIAGL